MRNFILASALIAVAAAQQSAWGQCGGTGWSGATSCISGYTCSKMNDFYSQCIPGSQATTTATTNNGGGSVSTTTTPTTTAGGASNTNNPFAGRTQWANPYYASEVSSLAIPSLIAAGNTALASAAAKVAQVPSFTWLDTRAKVPSVRTYLQSIKDADTKNVIVPLVVYDLPERDCAAAASNGELSLANNGSAIYQSDYIDAIYTILADFPDIPVALIIEPDSLANLVTNSNVAKCSNAASAYKTLIAYAVKKFGALSNVAQYLDGGHGGWLGWPANLPPAAQLFAQIRQDAGSPANLRGLATNVANYNAWSIATCPSYTTPNPNCDEKRYIDAMASALDGQGWSNTHYIVDQGRSGKQPTGQIQQGDWCNALGTGFGTRPGTTPDDANLDAFVWVKPGGESDGTSNTSSARYDYHCGQSDALQPAPEAGTWFQAYFVQLLTNANPSFT